MHRYEFRENRELDKNSLTRLDFSSNT